jgi:hypothetical protein
MVIILGQTNPVNNTVHIHELHFSIWYYPETLYDEIHTVRLLKTEVSDILTLYTT